MGSSASGPHPVNQGQCPAPERRLALLLEYDGTRYNGFQWQAQFPSVQGELEKGIKSLTGETTRVRGASRTDSGVHARGQVVDFLTRSSYTTETFINALNWYLSSDIRVRGACGMPQGFNSRKEAVSRVYRYTVLNARWPSALLRDFSHWVSASLDVPSMVEGAGYLVGAHDFSALASPLPPRRSPVRRVGRWDVWRDGELVLIEAEANSFLPHQIRRTNGVLLGIGLGRLDVGVMREMLNGALKEPSHSPSLPAKGLCLIQVNYANLLFSVDRGYEEP
jgi:tRNA pseudouridine38-40 synthase